MQIRHYYSDTKKKNVNEFLFYATIQHVLMKNVYTGRSIHMWTYKRDGWMTINKKNKVKKKKISRTENNELCEFINLRRIMKNSRKRIKKFCAYERT